MGGYVANELCPEQMVHHVNHPQAPAIINLVNSVQHSFGVSHFPEISSGLHYQLP